MNMLTVQRQRRFLGALDGRPLEEHLGARIRHLRAQGKGVDARDLAVDRIVADVAQPAALCHRACQHAEDELDLIHPRIVGADIAVRGVQRAIHHNGIGILHRGAQRGVEHTGRHRKDDPVAVFDRPLQHLEGVPLTVADIDGGIDLIAENGLGVLSAHFMVADPARLFGHDIIDEGGFELGGLCDGQDL